SRVELWVRDENRAARGLYERLGWTALKSQPLSRESTRWLYSLDLNGHVCAGVVKGRPAARKRGLDGVRTFYDLRGIADLRSKDSSFGSGRLPVHVSEPYRYAEWLLTRLAQTGASRLLDLCCGTGVHSIYPAKLGMA